MTSRTSKLFNYALPLAVVLVSGLAASSALAQDSAGENCRVLTDPAQRLACYDRAFTAAPSPAPVITSPAPVQPAPPPSPTRPLPRSSVEQPPRTFTPPASVPFPSSTPDTDDLNQSVEDFQKSKERVVSEDTPKTLSSNIVKTSIFGYKKVRFFLENGQVWEQADSVRISEPRISKNRTPFAKISKAALGSFTLRVNGKGPATKVRRVR